MPSESSELAPLWCCDGSIYIRMDRPKCPAVPKIEGVRQVGVGNRIEVGRVRGYQSRTRRLCPSSVGSDNLAEARSDVGDRGGGGLDQPVPVPACRPEEIHFKEVPGHWKVVTTEAAVEAR